MKRRKVRFVILGIVITIVLLVGLIFTGNIRHTVTLSASDIQSALQSKFPVDKKELIFTAHFSDPTAKIDATSGRVTLGLSLKVSSFGTTLATGKGEATGELRYEPKTGEFFLESPEVTIDDLDLVRLAGRDKPKATKLLEQGLQEYFAKMPIYRLDDKDSKFVFARRVLKSMKVQDGKLEIELGF